MDIDDIIGCLHDIQRGFLQVQGQMETELERLEDENKRLKYELDKYKWRPIETFDNSMFSIMTTGIPDSCEVVKYKGDIPDWAAMWTAIPPIPRVVEESDGT